MAHGYKKFSAETAVYAGGLTIGQKVIAWAWDLLAVWSSAHGVPIEAMPPDMPANVMGLIMLLVHWWVREQDPAPLTMPTPAAFGGRSFDNQSTIGKENET
jgi:hypothetical protein